MGGWSVIEAGAALRETWDRGDPTLGLWTATGNTYVTEILGAAGFDWVGIDIQHGLVGPESMPSMILALAAHRIPAMVRVGWNDPAHIMRALDAGAAGVIIPMVESVADAQRAVDYCRYPPLGHRSWGATRGAIGVLDYTPERLNDTVVCCVMLESLVAVEAADEILAVEGIDAVFVGPSDLAVSMELRPALMSSDARHEEAIASVLESSRTNGVTPGIYCGSTEVAEHRIASGFQFVVIESDVGIVKKGVSQLRAWADRQSTQRPDIG